MYAFASFCFELLSLQRKLAAHFLIRQAEDEKTAEQVGTASLMAEATAPSSGIAGAAASSVGPVRTAEELEQKYAAVAKCCACGVV